MKAKEQIFSGDILVEDGGELRCMKTEEAGEYIGPGPFDYTFDKIKIAGFAAATYSKGEEVTMFNGNEIMEVQ